MCRTTRQRPFSRTWEGDRLLFCLGVSLLLHEKKKLISSPVEIRCQERHQTARNHSSFSRDHYPHYGTTKASHLVKHNLEKSSGHWQITNKHEHASSLEQPSYTARGVKLPILAVTQAGEETILQPVKKKGKKKKELKRPFRSMVLAHHQNQDRRELPMTGFAQPLKAFLSGNPFLFHIAFQAQA